VSTAQSDDGRRDSAGRLTRHGQFSSKAGTENGRPSPLKAMAIRHDISSLARLPIGIRRGYQLNQSRDGLVTRNTTFEAEAARHPPRLPCRAALRDYRCSDHPRNGRSLRDEGRLGEGLRTAGRRPGVAVTDALCRNDPFRSFSYRARLRRRGCVRQVADAVTLPVALTAAASETYS